MADPFKAYDIRGKVPEDLNEELVYLIGRAFVRLIGAKNVVVGQDIRTSSASLAQALEKGIVDQGADVIDIGLCGTEEVYFSTWHLDAGGGIMITASHNPKEYNGLKLVRAGARPVSNDSGLQKIRDMAMQGSFCAPDAQSKIRYLADKQPYIDHLLRFVDYKQFAKYKVVVNPGNGCAGPVLDILEKYLPLQFVRIHDQPDGTFPNGVPNPLLPENREVTAKKVIDNQADLGLAWDGDFDRCFFFDENGRFIEGYYLVGLLGLAMLRKYPGAKIIHDPRLTWNTREMVLKAGGQPVQSKTGHAFIKERMRKEDAIYGGEMSAHHYFRDFAYCDSGMLPWLLLLQIMGETKKSLSRLVDERIEAYPASGEINRKLADPKAALDRVKNCYQAQAEKIEYVDGLSMEFATWRFNLRLSNTEPVIRLNVESRADKHLMQVKTEEILKLMEV